MKDLIRCIFQDINQVLEYAVWAGCITVILSLIYVLFSKVIKKKICNCKKIFLTGMLVFYIILILIISIFSREPRSRIGVSFISGETWTQDWQGRAYVIENILLYIPFGMIGMGACSDAKRRSVYVTLAGFFLSLMVEVTQYITQMGYFQVDDLITNTLGTLAAVLFMSLINLLKSKICIKYKL